MPTDGSRRNRRLKIDNDMKSFIQHLSEQKPSLKGLVAANAKDLKDLPGAAGEAAHKRLHKTIAAFVKNSSKRSK